MGSIHPPADPLCKIDLLSHDSKGYISSRKMQAEMKKVQPELDEIKKKYKDDFLLQQQEMQRIHQENNINPLASVSSGCLPMLVSCQFGWRCIM